MLQRLKIQLASEQELDKFLVVKHNAIHARSSQEGLHKFTKQKAMGGFMSMQKALLAQEFLEARWLEAGKCLGRESHTLVLL